MTGSPAAHSADARLPLRTLAAFGAPQLGLTMLGTCCGVHLLFFYSDVAHLDPAQAGLILFIGAVWDAITDPIMGTYSDTRRWAAGRRRPFFLPGATGAALSFLLLFSPASALRDGPLFLYMLVLYLLFCTARTVVDVPYMALLPDLSPEYDERTRLAGWRQGMSVIGDIIGALLPTILLGTLLTARGAYGLASLPMAAIAIGCVALGYRGTFERTVASSLLPASMNVRGFLRRMRPAGDAQFSPVAWIRTPLRTVLAPLWSAPAMILVVAYALVAVGQGFGVATFLFVTKYFFHDTDMAETVMMFFFAGALLGIPVWIQATLRLAKKRAYQVAIFGYLFSTLPILFCHVEDRGLFLLCMFGIGVCNTGIWMVPDALAPDVIEYHRLHRGDAQEGAFYGTWQFLRKSAVGLSPWIVGLTLKATGFVPDQVQDGRTLQGILALFTLFPLAFMGTGVLLFTWYPITREVYADIRRQLDGAAA